MNIRICTRTCGSRSRSSPRSSSRGSVVAARIVAASTESVALASNPPPAASPDCDRDNPSTSTRGPGATNGISSANPTNGISTTSPRTSRPGPTPATAATDSTATRWPAYARGAQDACTGVATTSSAKARTDTTLRCGSSRCTRLVPARYRAARAPPWAAPTSVVDRRGGAAAADHQGQLPGDGQDGDHADDTGHAAGEAALGAIDGVVGQRGTGGDAVLGG